MNEYLKTSLIAGAIGAAILIVIMYLMMAAGLGPEPPFVGMFRALMGAGSRVDPPMDHVIGALGFALAGGVWGLLFAALVKRPGIVAGMLFGILPTLFLWVVMAPLMGQPLFNGFTPRGIIMPLVFNCLIWGSFVGWYCSTRGTLAAGRPANAPNNLFTPIEGFDTVEGDFGGESLSRSIYTWLQTHPAAKRIVTGAALGAALMLATKAIRRGWS